MYFVLIFVIKATPLDSDKYWFCEAIYSDYLKGHVFLC